MSNDPADSNGPAPSPDGQHPAYGEPQPPGPAAPWSQPAPDHQPAYGEQTPYSQQPTYSRPPGYGTPEGYGPPPGYGQVVNPSQLSPYAGYPPPVPAWAMVKPSPMPDGPREYQQMLRGPRHRWWRPLLALVLVVAIALPLMLLAFVPVLLAGVAAGVSDPLRWAAREIVETDNIGPGGFLYVNLSLIALIPAVGLSIWIAHRIRPRFVSSVQGGIRWAWLVRCVAVVVPVWAVYLGLSAVFATEVTPRPDQWLLLLVMVIFLTPFQAAAEEYFFRGWLMQTIGSWFRHPIVGLLVALAVSTSVFAWAHGSGDVWVIASLAAFALTAGIATWRTGGLEAGIAIHAVNNIGVFFTVILLGGWQNAFVSANTQGDPLSVVIVVVVHAVALALILWQAKRAGIQRRYQPAVRPADPAPAPVFAGHGGPAAG